jgi:hypothetical protein
MSDHSKARLVRDRSAASEHGIVIQAYSCDHCSLLLLGRYEGSVPQAVGATNAEPFLRQKDEYLEWTPVFGEGRRYEDVPEHIAGAASEAHACRSIGAHRAAVQLARSVVEATAKDKGITTGNLAGKIAKMQKEGLVRAHVREAADEIRHLGNEMAHGDFVEPVTSEEADETLELMAEVLHEVFQSPAKIERRKQARLARGTAGDTNS